MSVSHVSLSAFETTIAGQRRPVSTIVAAAEWIIACSLFCFTLPLMFAAAVLIMGLSRRSPLIAHRRVGYRGKEIWVLKLRTMWSSATRKRQFWPLIERLAPARIPISKLPRDARVTSRFAAICRKYSIDELPQLWHVITGDMALLGPRPLTADEIKEYYTSDSASLLSVKPGITGLWQVRGRSRLTYRQRRRLDLFLLRHWSLGLYTTIVKATISNVLSGRDAW